LNTAPCMEYGGGRTEVDFTMGGNYDGELYTFTGLHGPDKSNSSRGITTHDVIADSNFNPKKQKRNMVSIEQQPARIRPMDGLRYRLRGCVLKRTKESIAKHT
jgi:hypothetical protein